MKIQMPSVTWGDTSKVAAESLGCDIVTTDLVSSPMSGGPAWVGEDMFSVCVPLGDLRRSPTTRFSFGIFCSSPEKDTASQLTFSGHTEIESDVSAKRRCHPGT